MKIYDISQEVFSCCVYPGDPVPSWKRVLKIEEGAECNLTEFTMCAHNGTHTDAPFHFFNNGKTIDQVDLDRFIGYTYVAEHEGSLGAGDAEKILKAAKECDERAAERILIKGRAVITKEAAGVFKRAKIKLIGNESQTVGSGEDIKEVHLILLRGNIVILEGIRLKEVSEGCYILHAAPLKLGGAEGSPCRATLLEL